MRPLDREGRAGIIGTLRADPNRARSQRRAIPLARLRRRRCESGRRASPSRPRLDACRRTAGVVGVANGHVPEADRPIPEAVVRQIDQDGARRRLQGARKGLPTRVLHRQPRRAWARCMSAAIKTSYVARAVASRRGWPVNQRGGQLATCAQERTRPSAGLGKRVQLSAGGGELPSRRDGMCRREEPSRYEARLRARGSNQRFRRLPGHAVARALTTAPRLTGLGPAA